MSLVQHNQLTLISHTLCPFVQRAVIALEEQGLDYKRIDIDLNNKPEWFKTLSPLGKVPVLVVDDDTVLFESAVIAEYIHDISGAGLLSHTPVIKAKQRAWIEFGSATLNNISQLYSAKNKCDFDASSKLLNSKWAILEENLSANGLFSGEHFTLVDAAFAPVFRYFDVFEKFVEFKCLHRFSKIARWRAELAARESVVNAVSANYSEALTRFIASRDSYLGRLARNYQLDIATA